LGVIMSLINICMFGHSTKDLGVFLVAGIEFMG
jgi:hypothetical protein